MRVLEIFPPPLVEGALLLPELPVVPVAIWVLVETVPVTFRAMFT